MSLQRPCLGPGRGLPCPADEYVPSGRCSSCRSAVDVPRGTTTERGYGAAHQRARDELRELLPADCWYGCGTWLEPAGDWVAAHEDDSDPDSPRHPACRRCNERAKVRTS